MSALYGLIPAAGKGTRARPYSKMIPKCMLLINGVPNLQRNILIMRDQLNIHEIYIIIGYLGDYIKDYFKDGKAFNVSIHYIHNNDIDKGLAYSLLLGKKFIPDYFCVMLSDECYINTNHAELLSFPYRDGLGTCAVMNVDDRELIKQNYSVLLEGHFIQTLIEKPEIIQNDILGSGTFIFSPRLFDHLEQAFSNAHYVEFITFLNTLCKKGERLLSFHLNGNYVNINNRDSFHLAKYHDRNENFDQYKINLLIYSEGTEQNLAFTINRYKVMNIVHEIYVILPYHNQLEEIVQNSGAKALICPPEITLYGEKQKYAMNKVSGDILILCDADYSFPNRDILKLLTYLREADMVVGTRTTRQLIEQGSNMRGIVRFANIVLAKILEFFWWNFEARFTDVQCIFRAIWKTRFQSIQSHLLCRGAGFGAEMIMEVLNDRGRIIEIPVNYTNRLNSVYRKYQKFQTFFEILFLILKKKWTQMFRKNK